MRAVILALVFLGWAGPAVAWDTNDWQFLDTIERANLRFFQEQKRGPYQLVNDTADYDNIYNYPAYSSVAGVGFELSSICVGHYRGWIPYSNAYEQVLFQMRFWNNMLSTNPLVAERVNGWTWHVYYIDGTNAGTRFFFDDGLSLLDHSLFIAGCIFVAEYFKGTEAGELAHDLYEDTTWAWRPNGDYNFGYSENLLAIVEAAEAPQFKKGVEAYNMWRDMAIPPWPRTLQLYFWQYPHAYIDFRHRADDRGNNHADIARDSILYQRQRAIDMHAYDPARYDMIGSNCWGWTAASGSEYYRQLAPWGMWLNGQWYDEERMSDSGSVTPIGVPGCVVYAGSETLACMKYMYEKFYVDGWNPAAGQKPVWSDVYGWLNCINTGQPYRVDVTNWYHPVNAAIDYGPNVLLLDNYKLGTTWRWFMQNPYINAGMTTLGFGATQQVFIATFDNSSNQFGCGFGFWNNDGTTVSVSYADADLTNGYVGGKVVRIQGDSSDEGAWIDVCNRDMRAKAQLTLWVKAGTGQEQIDIGLKDQFGVENKVALAAYTGGAAPTNWTEVKIPIEAFCLTGNATNDVWPGSLSLVSFAFANTNGGALEVDHLGFTRDTRAPNQPTNAYGVAMAGRHARVHWDPARAERDVVGYHVWRRFDPTSGFVRVTSHLVPAYLGVYEDTNYESSAGQEVRYAIQPLDNGEPANAGLFSLEKLAYGGRLDLDWNNGVNPNVFGGSGDGYWGEAAPESFTFIFTNGPGGAARWVRRSFVSGTMSGHFMDLNGGDAADFWALGFWIRGAAGGEQVQIGLKDTGNNELKFDIDHFLDAGAVGTNWAQVIVPLSDFPQVDLTSLEQITLTHEAPGDVCLADIGFLGGQRAALMDDHFTECEDYTRQFGTTTQDFKVAASAGEVLGWGWGAIGGHYADYEFFASRSRTTPSIRLRYACNAGDGRLLDVLWNGQLVGTVNCTNTAGWGDTSNQFSWVSLTLPTVTAGAHKLTFLASTGDVPVNLDYWYLVDAQSALRECENFDAQLGSNGDDLKAGASGGAVLGQSWGNATNSTAAYSNVVAGVHTGAWFHLWYAMDLATGRMVDVYIDGLWRNRLLCPRTPGWGDRAQHFDVASAYLGSFTGGSHVVHLIAPGGASAINLDCFYIGGEAPEARAFDADGDGLSDRQETVAGSDAGQVDSDVDGLADADELTSQTTGQISDPSRSDTDGDGGSDFQEWVAGTDVNAPDSVFEVAAFLPMTNGINLQWPVISGRAYRVFYADGNYSDAAVFAEVSDPSNIVVQGGVGSYADTNSPAVRQYRLGVQKAP